MKASEMSESDLYAAAYQMEAMGGGFASAIATAFFRADSVNKQRLIQAFPELFEKYGEAK